MHLRKHHSHLSGSDVEYRRILMISNEDDWFKYMTAGLRDRLGRRFIIDRVDEKAMRCYRDPRGNVWHQQATVFTKSLTPPDPPCTFRFFEIFVCSQRHSTTMYLG
jgi:hypothetical protein